MSNPYRNEIEIELFGRTVKLRLTHQAIAEIEEARGAGIMAIARRGLPPQSFYFDDIVEVLYRGALAAENKDLPTRREFAEEVLKAGVTEYIVDVSHFLTLVYTGVLEKKA